MGVNQENTALCFRKLLLQFPLNLSQCSQQEPKEQEAIDQSGKLASLICLDMWWTSYKATRQHLVRMHSPDFPSLQTPAYNRPKIDGLNNMKQTPECR